MIAVFLVAQLVTARPGVDCSLLTATQAQGLVCANTPKADAPAPVPDDCATVDPYRDPDAAVRCAFPPDPSDRVPTFLIGAIYSYGYDEIRATVLGVTRDVDGVQVITVRWHHDDRALQAIRTPAVPRGETVWRLITPQATPQTR